MRPRPDDRRRWLRRIAALALVLACGFANHGALAASATPQGPESGPDRRQLWLIPASVPGVLMHAWLYRPPGNGPFPLALINHGSDQGDMLARTAMSIPTYPVLTAWLLAQGYAVLVPERPGHGETGGPYIEDHGSCEAPDYARAGNATADSIAAAIAGISTQPFIRPQSVVVFGHSAGAWGALALAGRNPRNVRAVVNFSGGRGGRSRGEPLRNCAPDRLVAAAAVFGRTARTPTLWLYATNDTYFGPDLSRMMVEAYKRSGGKAEYHLLPPVGGEGHALIQAPGPVPPWAQYVKPFLGR